MWVAWSVAAMAHCAALRHAHDLTQDETCANEVELSILGHQCTVPNSFRRAPKNTKRSASKRKTNEAPDTPDFDVVGQGDPPEHPQVTALFG